MSKELYEEWLKIKDFEAKAYARKLEIEKELLKSLGIDRLEGSKTLKDEGFKINLIGKLNQTVNAEALKSLPVEYPEITREVLGRAFRWKPEIDAKAWKLESEEVREILSRAITVTPAKIGFKIEKIEE
ncbi:hypothetical protein [Caudoviricetes sp.]|nr:hypothetical protein [Caudoviricetes sp.]